MNSVARLLRSEAVGIVLTLATFLFLGGIVLFGNPG